MNGGDGRMNGLKLVLAIIFLAGAGQAQGSKGRIESLNVDGAKVSGTNISDSVGKICGKSGDLNGKIGYEDEDVDFLDRNGRVVKRIRRVIEGYLYILGDREGRHVLIVRGGSVPNRAYRLDYLDTLGRILWTTDVCCATIPPGGSIVDAITISEDGSLVAIRDVPEGEKYPEGEGFAVSPPGCVGLRVFDEGGGEVYRTDHALGLLISPKGKYVVYWTNMGYFIVDVKKKVSNALPVLPKDADSAWGVNDSGQVDYFRPGGEVPPGRAKYQYIPGKGLEKIRD